MKKNFLSLLILFAPLFSSAQITVSVQLPAGGMVQKDQLWNLVLTNSGSPAIEATILLNLQDARTGQSVLSAFTRRLLLPKGIKMLSPGDVQPVQYNTVSGSLGGNYLPLGSYIACYTVTQQGHARPETVAQECVRINIQPLSPPMLNTPANETIIQTGNPQLTWTPPSPISMFDNLSYDINIVEVMPGQSPSDAMRFNTPVYMKTHSTVSYENYPTFYSPLQKGKVYAWQVTARNGLNYAASTEVWTFRLKNDSLQEKISPATYVLLKSGNNPAGVNYVSGNNLHIKYYSFDKNHQSEIRLLDSDRKVVREAKQNINYGDNFISIRLNNSFSKGHIYFIEIADQHHRVYSASFSIL